MAKEADWPSQILDRAGKIVLKMGCACERRHKEAPSHRVIVVTLRPQFRKTWAPVIGRWAKAVDSIPAASPLSQPPAWKKMKYEWLAVPPCRRRCAASAA